MGVAGESLGVVKYYYYYIQKIQSKVVIFQEKYIEKCVQNVKNVAAVNGKLAWINGNFEVND